MPNPTNPTLQVSTYQYPLTPIPTPYSESMKNEALKAI